ncbi:MAG: sensor domain-containing diguanylate cyclase [Acidobacteriaceae bacterium]
MLVSAAICAVLVTVLAGSLVYSNTQKLISAAGSVEHSREVLSALQDAWQITERIEFRTRLYLLTGDADQISEARSGANQLDIAALHLKALVADNRGQSGNVEDLASCTEALSHALNGLNTQSALPSTQLLYCQETISLMSEQEHRLLDDRDQKSQHISTVSLVTEAAFVGLSLLTLIVLFGFLLRDALLRQRTEQQTLLTNEELAQSIKALEDRAHESDLLTSARDELQLCVDLRQVYQSAANSFSRLLPQSSGSLCMINNSRQMVEVVSSWGESLIESFSPPESCCGLRSGQPRWRQPGVSELHCSHFAAAPPDNYLCVPIVAHGDTMGVLSIECPDKSSMLSIRERFDGLRQLLQLTGMAVASLNLQTKLENQSLRDPLTGLYNHHFMQIALERELARAIRRKSVLALFMLDIDHFKRFNDTYGHAAGDTVLKAVAEVFRSIVRGEDIVCRYGGEEFTIILPDIGESIANERAETIRKSVEMLRVPLKTEDYAQVEVTVSIGVAFYPDDGTSSDTLLRMADQALYRAKRKGRNQVSNTPRKSDHERLGI